MSEEGVRGKDKKEVEFVERILGEYIPGLRNPGVHIPGLHMPGVHIPWKDKPVQPPVKPRPAEVSYETFPKPLFLFLYCLTASLDVERWDGSTGVACTWALAEQQERAVEHRGK